MRELMLSLDFISARERGEKGPGKFERQATRAGEEEVGNVKRTGKKR